MAARAPLIASLVVPLMVPLMAPLSSHAQAIEATSLMQAWQAATQHDKAYAVARAAHAAAQPRRDQSTAIWRPTVGLVGSVGVATHESRTRGAQFEAPGFGQSRDVGFSTSVTNGTATRWALAATQPLYDPKRRAAQQQLSTSVDLAEVQWQAAGQSLMLRTVERYFDLALAEETLRVLSRQLGAVQRTETEARDRFQLGAVPVTDTHEAAARLAAVRAQVLAAESEVHVKRGLLSDATGLTAGALTVRLPGASRPDDVSSSAPLRPLAFWLDAAQSGNPGIRAQTLALEVARQEAARHRPGASPTVDLVAQVGRDRLSGSGDFGSASNVGTQRMVGIQVSVPLFTGGYRSAREEEALRLVDQAAAEVEQAREQAGQQVRAAWLGLSVGAERVHALEQAAGASRARRDTTRLGLEVGERTTLDLLNAENEAAAAELALAQARVGLMKDRLRLAALAGLLDEATLRAADGGQALLPVDR